MNTIRAIKPSDHGGIVDVLKSTYHTLPTTDFDAVHQNLVKHLDCPAVVAVDDNKIVGYGFYSLLRQLPKLQQVITQLVELTSAALQDPNYVNIATKAVKEHNEEQGNFGEVALEVFDNDFSRNLNKPSGNELYLFNLAVSPEYRGRGIGKKLVDERLRIGKEKLRSCVALTDCWDGGSSKKIYEGLGFSPYLHFGIGNRASVYVGKNMGVDENIPK